MEGTGTGAPSVGGRETILVAEDEEDVRDLVEELLTGLGYTVLSAPSGEEALKVFGGHAGTIDLLLTDVVMTGMSGLDLVHQDSRATTRDEGPLHVRLHRRRRPPPHCPRRRRELHPETLLDRRTQKVRTRLARQAQPRRSAGSLTE